MNTTNAHLVRSSSGIHGAGLFATAPIVKDTMVIEYVGEKIDSQEMLRRCAAGNHYIFKLNTTDYLDGEHKSNFARYINHSCEPNCTIRWEHDRIWIVADRHIGAGEEITFNYSYDLEDYRHYPCRCGSVQCVGYMVAEEFFDHVRRQNEDSLSWGRGPGEC